jgi:predicted transcriptional regulator
MPRGHYDPVLSKTDPLESVHVKLPKSTNAVIRRVAARRQRPATFIIREAMVAWAREYVTKNTDLDDELAEFETERGRAPKPKRRVG